MTSFARQALARLAPLDPYVVEFTLTPAEVEQFRDALLSAFSLGDLEQVVFFGLEENLESLVERGTSRQMVTGLVKWANSKRKVWALLTRARADNPGNAQLRQFDEYLRAKYSIVVPDVHELKGRQLQQAIVALSSAYSTKAALSNMVTLYLGERLDAIVGGGPIDNMIFNLLEWARMRGRMTELLQGAVNGNPTNPELLGFIRGLA